MKKTLGIIAAVGAGVLLVGSILYFAAILMGGQGKNMTFENGWSMHIGRGGFHLYSTNWKGGLDFLDWDDWDEYEEQREDFSASGSGSTSSRADLNGMTPLERNSGEAVIPAGIQEVRMELQITDLDIERAPSTDIILRWENLTDYSSISYQTENNVLTVKETDLENSIRDGLLNGLFPGDEDRKITLYLPADYPVDFYVETGVGDVEVENIAGGKFTCNIGTGDLDLKNFTVGSITISAGTGDVEAENVQISEKSSIACGMGDIEMSNITANGLQLETGTGDVSLSLTGKQADFSYSLSTNMGEIRMNKQTVSSPYQEIKGEAPMIQASSGMGDISVRIDK